MSGSLNDIVLMPGTYFCVEKIGLEKKNAPTVFERNRSKATYLAEKD
jgi:hypothetical protein